MKSQKLTLTASQKKLAKRIFRQQIENYGRNFPADTRAAFESNCALEYSRNLKGVRL